jgi:hypothetical protein
MVVKGKKCQVVENATNQVVVSDVKPETGKDFELFLNSGGGFDGFTPTFFLRSKKISYK